MVSSSMVGVQQSILYEEYYELPLFPTQTIATNKETIMDISDIAGKDAPVEFNAKGGGQSHIPTRFDLIDGEALFKMAAVLYEGAKKYGANNWRKIDIEDHLNHLIVHAYAYLSGDRSDEHLSHIMCRAMFAQAVEIQEDKHEALADDFGRTPSSGVKPISEDQDWITAITIRDAREPDNKRVSFRHVYRADRWIVVCEEPGCELWSRNQKYQYLETELGLHAVQTHNATSWVEKKKPDPTKKITFFKYRILDQIRIRCGEPNCEWTRSVSFPNLFLDLSEHTKSHNASAWQES